MRRLLTSLCIIFTYTLSAQTDGGNVLTIKGKVVDAGTGDPMDMVAIVNTTTQQVVYTDGKGNYTINAHAGETISARYLGYRTSLMPISSGSEFIPVNITLSKQNIQMTEVVVRPKYTPYQADSIQRHSTYQRTLARGHEGSVMSPVSWLAERVSGKSKARFRFQKEFARLENERFVETRYSPELVTQMTYLTGDTLAYFMNAYPMPTDYARAASDLELKMWIRTNYREWKAKGMPMPQVNVTDTTAQRKP